MTRISDFRQRTEWNLGRLHALFDWQFKTRATRVRFLRHFDTSIPLVRLGTDYGGWWVPASMLDDRSVVYSFEVGTDISFDLALLDTTGCQMYLFDPTPKAVAFMASQYPHPRLHFRQLGLWDADTEISFFPPKNPEFASFSAFDSRSGANPVVLPVATLETIMIQNGHEHVDLIKMDIEQAENRVLPRMPATTVRPRFLLVEFDQPWPMRSTWRLIDDLISSGYAPLHVDRWNWTFAYSN